MYFFDTEDLIRIRSCTHGESYVKYALSHVSLKNYIYMDGIMICVNKADIGTRKFISNLFFLCRRQSLTTP